MLTRGFVGGLLVLMGGLVISTLPESTPILGVSLLEHLRTTMVGRMCALAVVVTGLGLMAAAWLSLCRHVARVTEAGQDEAVSLVRFATVVWCAPLVLAPPLFSRDGWSYAAQGMLTHFKLSPYEHGPGWLMGPIVEGVDPRWLYTMAPYGPIPLIFGDFAARFTGNPWMLVLAHRALAFVGLALLAWAIPRLARWNGLNPALASAVVLVSPLMLAHGIGGLHNDLLMVGFMAAALVSTVEVGERLGQRWGWVAGGVLGGLAAGVKLPGGLVCIGVVLLVLPAGATLLQRVRTYAKVSAVAVVTLLAPGFLWGLGAGWASALGVPGTVNTPLSMPTVVGGGIDRLAMWLGLGLAPATFLELVRSLAQVAALLIAAWVALRWRSGDRAEAVRAVALVVGALVLLSPVVHLWYFLWFFPMLACIRLSALAGAWLIAASVISGLVAPLDSSLHGAYIAIIVGSLLVTAATLILLATRSARERLDRIVSAPPIGPVVVPRPRQPRTSLAVSERE